MNEWEYRVVCRTGVGKLPTVCSSLQAAQMEAMSNDNPPMECSPHRVERRRVGPWEPVEEGETR